MSNDYYKLRWTSADGQGEMPSGEFSSKAEAIANIAKAKAEHLVGCTSDDDRAGIEAGSFDVLYTGPEIVVEDISVEDVEGDLMATFRVRQIAENGDEVVTDAGEWIDYEDGLLDGQHSNLGSCGELSWDAKDKVYNLVEAYLRANPIDDDLLESYQLAAESRQEAIRYAMR